MNGSSPALWAALASFFGSLIAFKVIGLFMGGNLRLGVSALLTALATGGVVYAKSRLDDLHTK